MRIICFHLNQVGDLMFSLPALKSIRDTFPDSHITSVVRPSLQELLEATGILDTVLSRNAGFNLDRVRLIRSLSALKPDVAVVFSQSASCASMAYLSGAPKRVGFENTSMGFLLTTRLPFQHPPSTENNLKLIEAIGAKITCRQYSGLLCATADQIEKGNAVLERFGVQPDEPVAALAPATSSNRSVKEWTNEGFIEVGNYLAKCGFRPVMLGAADQSTIVKEYECILDMRGQTTLGEVTGILQRSKLLVAVDSGLLHLCAAIGTPVIGLYGSSNPAITGPQGDSHIVLTSGADCSPCVKTSCSFGRKCMLDITPSYVISAVDSILGRDTQ
ncbi:MAG: glycosyltransferase family 9 protein [Armatimonadota bacterium]|jgi:lipopolysaccharide heptosyltransferase II